MKQFLLIVSVLTFSILPAKLYATTTTAGAAPTSTAGMYQTQSQTNVKPTQSQQSGAVTATSQPVDAFGCVDSGILGTRCGVKAEQFCKNNPDNPDCRKILKDSDVKK